MLIEQKQKIKIKINPADFMVDIKWERERAEFVQFSISMASIQLIKNYDCFQLRINLCSHSALWNWFFNWLAMSSI